MEKVFFAIFVSIFILTFVNNNFAEDQPTNTELLKQIKELKKIITEQEKRITELESKVKEYEPKALNVQLKDTTLEDLNKHVDTHLLHRLEGYQLLDGLRIGIGTTFVVQGAINANNTTKTNEDITDASYSVDLEFEKTFDDWGLAFMHLETGDGAGLEDELQLYSNVNRDANDVDNTIKIADVWYEHYLFDKQFSIKAGKLDPTIYVDQNEIAHNETTQFLGRIFRNAPTIDFPDNNAGFHLLIKPQQVHWLQLEGQILDADGDWEDIGDDVFITYQTNLKPMLLQDLLGNYRVYGWYKDINYIEWLHPENQFKEKYGFGISADQQLSDIFTIFGRYGWCDPDVYASGTNFSLEHAWSVGCQLNGKPWGRKQDCIAAAIGMTMPSDKYKEAGTNLKADDEGHFEAYYSWQINKHLTLSPDIHIIWNPYGSDHAVSGEKRDNTITVIGCRGQVDF